MRFIITATASPDAKTGGPPPDMETFAAYMRFNEDLTKAGVLVASEGLLPGAPSARIETVKGKRKLLDGPYAESKELLGGFYVIEVASKEEAVAWALRCPLGLGTDDILEVRQMTGVSDIPEEMVKIVREAAPTWSAAFLKPR